jgi:hypothetical protein
VRHQRIHVAARQRRFWYQRMAVCALGDASPANRCVCCLLAEVEVLATSVLSMRGHCLARWVAAVCELRSRVGQSWRPCSDRAAIASGAADVGEYRAGRRFAKHASSGTPEASRPSLTRVGCPGRGIDDIAVMLLMSPILWRGGDEALLVLCAVSDVQPTLRRPPRRSQACLCVAVTAQMCTEMTPHERERSRAVIASRPAPVRLVAARRRSCSIDAASSEEEARQSCDRRATCQSGPEPGWADRCASPAWPCGTAPSAP